MEESLSQLEVKINNEEEVSVKIIPLKYKEYMSHNTYSSDTESEIDYWDQEIESTKQSVYYLDEKIERFTNEADRIDIAVSAACGLLCGLIDAFFIGEFSFERGMNVTNEELTNKIFKIAKEKGWNGVERGSRKGEFTLDSAISFLEKKFKMPSDPLENEFGGTRQHHLRDFAHHHSIIGLFFSILTQFTGKAYGTDTNGFFVSFDVPKEMIGTDLRRKWAIAVTDWSLHLVSDMHGSSATAGRGAGIPGPILSMLKAFSALPIFGTRPHIQGEKPEPNKLSLFVSKLYNGTLLGQRDENGKLIPVKIDLRGEKAISHELGRQVLPVIINEILVRSFYLIRRLCVEIKANEIHSFDEIDKLDWGKVIPVFNRTVNRMMLVASGTFMAVDVADAAIRSAVKSGGRWEKFGVEMLLHINYPNIGRVCIAIGTEGYMAFRRSKLRTERMAQMTELIQATNIKVFYRQKEMWIAAEQSESAINDLYSTAEQTGPLIAQCLVDIENDYHEIGTYRGGIEKNNPWIMDMLNN